MEIFASVNCIAQLHYKYNDSNLGVMPLFHTMEFDAFDVCIWWTAHSFVCPPMIKKLVELVDSEKINNLFLVPTMFHDLVHSNLAEFNLSSVKKYCRNVNDNKSCFEML